MASFIRYVNHPTEHSARQYATISEGRHEVGVYTSEEEVPESDFAAPVLTVRQPNSDEFTVFGSSIDHDTVM
jgi:hypothetical protein